MDPAALPERLLPVASDPVSVLVVDDEPIVRTVLTRIATSWGHEVVTTASGEEALEVLRGRRFTLMLCDQQMPGMTGVATVDAALAIDPHLAVVMLTGADDARVATEVLTRGAFGYVTKPFDLGSLRDSVERALHRRTLAIEQRRIEQMIREEVAVRTEELEREKQRFGALTVGIAETLINAMEAKDVYLRGHSQRVADLGALVAHHMGHDAETVERIRLAGRLHDVGKIGIRESVLNKPGKLTPEEFDHVKDHVRIGMDILAPLTHLGTVLDYVQDHHEHWNGRGYPRAIEGERISVGGRILTAADTFDALTSKRAYRDPMVPDATIEFMSEVAGGHLDPDVYLALREIVLARRVLPFVHDQHAFS